jgi:hypothetical protein
MSTSRGVRFGVGASTPSLGLPALRTRPSAQSRGVVILVRSGQWAVAGASECASTATRRRQLSQLFAAIPRSLARHATWALSVVTTRLGSIWGRGDRGRAAPCRAVSPDPCTGREHCTTGRRRARKPPKNYICLHWHHRFRYVGWFVCILLQISFSLFRSTNKFHFLYLAVDPIAIPSNRPQSISIGRPTWNPLATHHCNL